MTKNVNLFVLIILLLLPGTVFAANHYVRAGATGSNNGSDWANAWTSLPSTLIRGDIYYIADGTYGSNTFNDAVSGTTVITVKKATAADHGTDTGWNNTYGEGQAIFTAPIIVSTGYWVFDGATRTSITTGHGIVINCSSGAKGMIITGASNSTFKYIAVIGSGPDGSPGYANDLIYSLDGTNNVTIQYSYFYNAGRTHILARGSNTWLIEHSYFDTNESVAAQHSEGISALSSNNWEIRYCTWIREEGTGILVFGTGGGWKIHGNVFEDHCGDHNHCPGGASRLIGGWTVENISTAYIYNNTFVNNHTGNVGYTNDTNINVKNNLYINNTGIASFNYGSGTHDYNAFNGVSTFSEANGQANLTSAIFVDYAGQDYRLSGPTNSGDNSITSVCPACATDAFGNTRGADGVWDRGAYEYTGGGGGGGKVPQPQNIISIQ